jgi:hypothetical protein
MTHTVRVAMVAVAMLAGPGADLLACGDKFLVASRGTRFQRAGLVRRPAAILIYAAPASRLATSVESLGVAAALTKVGYTATIVSTPAGLADAQRQGRWDLVLIDLADTAAVPRAAGPAVVAVAYDTAGDALKQARRDHDAVIRRPGRVRVVVDAIDDVLFERALRSSGARASN